MKVYINGSLVPSRIEVLPNNTPTQDETLETFSFALISNTDPFPLAPLQNVKVDFLGDGTEVVNFYLVSDSVETFSLNPLRYKHNISCIQNTRIFSKHVVRNSVFSQPAYLYKKSYNATSQGAFASGSSGGLSSWHNDYVSPSDPNLKSKPLHLTSKEKINKAYFKLGFQFGYGQFSSISATMNTTAHNKNDIMALATSMTSITIANSLTLRYKDPLGVTQIRTINPSYFNLTDFDLNNTFEFPLIKDLANLGCNDFELLFDDRLFLDGTYSVDDVRVLFWMAQLEIVVDIYYLSCYDALNLLVERQKKETSINSPAPLFSLPQSGVLYNLLKETVAPNFTFTNLTLYECVAEVFRLFDAIFTMDENRVLGIEYFNNLDNEVITPRLTGKTLALGEDKYTNGLIAHYQDARVVETFPRDGKFAHLRSVEFGVPEAQDHNFIVPHNIQSIVKFEVLLEGLSVDFGGGVGNPWNAVTSMGLDITDFVFDESVWSTLNTGAMQNSDYDSYLAKQANSVYFTKGDNVIKIAATFKDSWNITHYTLLEMVQMAILKLAGVYTVTASNKPKDRFYPHPNIYSGTWRSIKMRLTYIASVDGKTETHSLTNKYNGETLIDQSNGAVDLNKLGLNMLGLSLKLGNPTLNATHRITRWANRIKVGQIYNYKGSIWVANVVNYTFLGNGYLQGKVSFVQNFNQLALRTQLLREKRMSNISKELVQKSEEILTDYIYYSSEQISETAETIHFNFNYLIDFLKDSFNIVGPYHKIGDVFIYNTDDVVDYTVDAIYIPCIKYGAGNTINFEMGFEHPMNAGNKTKYIETSQWWGNNKYFTEHVIYTDDYGFKDTISIKAPTENIDYTQEFPKVTIHSSDAPNDEGVGYFDIVDFKVYKQPNEIFALNYQLAFLPIPGRENIDFIGSEFINNNCFVKEFDEQNKKRYICFFNKKCSALDLKATQYLQPKRAITSVVSTLVSSGKIRLDLNFTSLSSLEGIVSWAIVDENDNVLFASNNELPALNKACIYFLSKLERLD